MIVLLRVLGTRTKRSERAWCTRRYARTAAADVVESEVVMYREYKAYKSLKPTPPDIEGPFYKPGAPFTELLTDQPSLTITGRVTDIEGRSIQDVMLDIWQANAKGLYDNDGYHLRGRQEAPDGKYAVYTLHPGDYQIDESEYRCSHIHVKVTAPGYKPLTTQLYFADDKYNVTDHWFDPRRVIGSITCKEAVFDFVLEKE